MRNRMKNQKSLIHQTNKEETHLSIGKYVVKVVTRQLSINSVASRIQLAF